MSQLPSEMVSELRNSFNSGKTRHLHFRIKQLQNLLRMYTEKKDEILAALWADLHKCKGESMVMEIDILVNDIKNTLYNLYSWTRPERVSRDLANVLDDAYIQREPYGVALVIGAWNYPIHLTLLPVQGAIAAGNCVLIKPSEVSQACAKLMAEVIPQYLDPDCYKVFTGNIPETTELLKERFDHIFFTGNSAVGKVIHAAATKHLTPVTLELGGKSPCYIDDSVNYKVAAKRIMWGKVVNAGQTCVAPDYLLCTKEVEQKFIKAAKEVLLEFFGENPKESAYYGRIIADRHIQRLQRLIQNGNVAVGGEIDTTERYIAPTILTGVTQNDPIMMEEVFGPILPIINVSSCHDVIDLLNRQEKPLTLYIFSNIKSDVELLVKNTSSGGVCINDTIIHLAVQSLPFGGVGHSGMGSYHGKFSFDTFSHKKAVLHKNLGALGETLGAVKYPPMTPSKVRYLQFIMAKRPWFNAIKCGRNVVAFILGLASFYLWNAYGNQLI
ncbi:aldehyde dehydrogenase, dimeric NADP-preferring-like [Euwallacea similis]|uniref:aldehyde dehydrogenase, dimeric NADP-preferring-like n=1 Tax=Euwallacea similis TaxID=1736056 RepID=UPI00344D7070